MSNLFMIGNGFDLSCGLASSYKDKCKGYISFESNNQTIVWFKQNMQEDIDTRADFELSMAKFANKFNSEDDFILCVRDFKKYLQGYLKREELEFRGKFKNQPDIFYELQN